MSLARIAALLCGALSLPVLALDEHDLTTARVLHVAGESRDALAILQPCLAESAQKTIKAPVLEECLFLGDEAATAAVNRGPERDSGDFAKSMADLGVPVATALYGHTYDHAYLARLQALFPRSKYSDHAAYYVNRQGENWENEVAHLEGYLAAFPNGVHARLALAQLAWIYDNAWDYTRPDSEDSAAAGYLGTDTGDPAENTKKAERYRNKAIQYYERAITRSIGHRDAPYERESAAALRGRLAGIKAREHSGFVVIQELVD